MVEKQQIKSGIQDGGLLGSKVRVTPLRKYEVKSDQTRQKAIELQNTRPGASRDSNTATTNHPNASVQATKHTEVHRDNFRDLSHKSSDCRRASSNRFEC